MTQTTIILELIDEKLEAVYSATDGIRFFIIDRSADDEPADVSGPFTPTQENVDLQRLYCSEPDIQDALADPSPGTIFF
jgi:hypothetical protein